MNAILPRRCSRSWARCLGLALLGVVLSLAALPASSQVLVVVSDQSPAYEDVVAELRAGLPARDEGDAIEVVTAQGLAQVNDTALRKQKLVITVGLGAAQTAVARDRAGLLPLPAPVLCLLIPRQSFERLVPPDARARISAVFIDQPLSRQLELLRLALPDKRNLGTVLGPNSREWLPELNAQARARGMSVHAAEVAEASSVYSALSEVTPESDVLLLLPDPVATSADTVYGLMLATYRAQVPVFGFSESLAKAGALISLYSSARQQGRQGAEIARRMLADEARLPAPQHPRLYTVRINPSVARSLGLRLPNEARLTADLAARESAAESPRAGDDAPGDRP